MRPTPTFAPARQRARSAAEFSRTLPSPWQPSSGLKSSGPRLSSAAPGASRGPWSHPAAAQYIPSAILHTKYTSGI